jgi:hypothetical protein
MAVFRVEKTRDCIIMSNYHLKDKGLTLKGQDCRGVSCVDKGGVER